MTREDVVIALSEMQSYARKREDLYKQGGEYEMLTARNILARLGYEEGQQDEVLVAIGEHGFSYCLDPLVPHRENGERPSIGACIWTVEQLRSRLDCVRIPEGVLVGIE